MCSAHHDWAACFPLGRGVADQFASENGLAVVSEVIPDSNCFQGKTKPDLFLMKFQM